MRVKTFCLFIFARNGDLSGYNLVFFLFTLIVRPDYWHIFFSRLGEDLNQKDSVKCGSLCSCAITVLSYLTSHVKLTPLLRSLLDTERAVSLTQVKSVLDFSLWGPSDVNLSNNIRERELALQRWLDLQRATVLHGLVCANICLRVYEECHLLFLVRSNAKMLCDASLLIDASTTSGKVP